MIANKNAATIRRGAKERYWFLVMASAATALVSICMERVEELRWNTAVSLHVGIENF